MSGERRKQKETVHEGKYDVVELFSRERVTAIANAMGYRGGWSLDINFDDSLGASAT